MDKEKREKVERLKLEAHRFAAQFGTHSGSGRTNSFAGHLFRPLKEMPCSARYGLVAILVSYPGLIPIIALGGTNPLPQNLAIGCFSLVSMSLPYFLMACKAERAER